MNQLAGVEMQSSIGMFTTIVNVAI